MSDYAAHTIAEALRACGIDEPERVEVPEILAALKAAGIAVIELPIVAHKGPQDTDAKFFRQVSDRMEDPTRRIDYLSGGNVRHAVRELLYRAAAAAESGR